MSEEDDTKTEGLAKIEITMLQLITEFHPAISSLGNLQINNIDVLMSVVRVKKLTDEKAKEYAELEKIIIESNCEKDKDGQPIIQGNQVVNGLLMELQSKQITIEVKPISLENLNEVKGLSANVIIALREFIKE